MDRRNFSAALAALFGLGLGMQPAVALSQAWRRRRRRRIRRRVRRRVVVRTVFGRPFWVVPVGLVIGWELVHRDRVVVVRQVRVVEREGRRVEVAVVADAAGTTEEVEILREDTPENLQELEGTLLAENDQSTPGIESVIEE